MSAEVFRLVILVMYAVGIAIAAYYEGKTKGFSQGYNSGYEVGCIAGKFNALCLLIERDMDEGGDAE